MSSFEAFVKFITDCERCKTDSKIIEFEDLPEREKCFFSFYNKNNHFLLHCERCKMYNIIGSG
jgi:hypothetical protein